MGFGSTTAQDMTSRPGGSGRLAVLALVGMFMAAGAAATPAVAARLGELPQRWRADDGHVLSLTDWSGRRVVLTMAYAECRKICPETLGTLQRLQRQLDERGERAEFVFVGYDPQADSPAAWHRYRHRHGLSRDNWHFLSGSRSDTGELARLLGFTFWKYDDHVVHESRVVVFDATGTLRVEAEPGTIDRLAVL
jgi:protein SCO1